MNPELKLTWPVPPSMPSGSSRLNEFLLHAEDLYESFAPVGSRITCVPPPSDTDADYLILSKSGCWEDVLSWLHLNGWELDGSQVDNPYDPNSSEELFQSFSYNEINLIVTPSEVFNARFLAATSVARRLNLLNKDDRIALFQAVLYGNAS